MPRRGETARSNRGAQWERILRTALPDVDPRWTLTGRGSRTTLTWGQVGWVWQHVGVNLKSGGLHELYASRTWTDEPLSRTIDARAGDLLPDASPDRLFQLEAPGAVGQVVRWAALVPEQAFNRTLEQDLGRFERQFARYLTSGGVLRWSPLPGLQVAFDLDARPAVEVAEQYTAEIAAVTRGAADDPSFTFWAEFRSRLDQGREATLVWLDEHRRTSLHAEKVPDDLVDPVLEPL